MSEMLRGRRILPDAFCDTREHRPGDYGRDPDGNWWVVDPSGTPGGIFDHTVEEHEDGTITVSPSILDATPGGWHGWLERGVWRSA